MSDERESLLHAWENWDEAAERISARGIRQSFTSETLRRESEAMDDTCKVYAPVLGLDVSAFRGLLAAWRRAGRSRVESLVAVEMGVGL